MLREPTYPIERIEYDGKPYKVCGGTYYNVDTPDTVIRWIEYARLLGLTVRLFYGDTKTGRDWMEENDVRGRISRSMGPVKIPILLATRRSIGGTGILDSRIVRLLIGGAEVYRHSTYHLGNLAVTAPDLPDYAATVTHNGDVHARFRSVNAAHRWIAFMRGDRQAK